MIRPGMATSKKEKPAGAAPAKKGGKAASAAPRPATPEWEGLPALVVISGGSALIGSRLNLKDGRTVVGRAPGVGITLLDGSLSRKHAELVQGSDGKVAIFDLGSKHGVLVNEKKVNAAELRDGDYVQLGALVFKFRTSTDSPARPGDVPRTGSIPGQAD